MKSPSNFESATFSQTWTLTSHFSAFEQARDIGTSWVVHHLILVICKLARVQPKLITNKSTQTVENKIAVYFFRLKKINCCLLELATPAHHHLSPWANLLLLNDSIQHPLCASLNNDPIMLRIYHLRQPIHHLMMGSFNIYSNPQKDRKVASLKNTTIIFPSLKVFYLMYHLMIQSFHVIPIHLA